MAALRLRKTPALSSALALPRYSSTLRVRSFSALRSKTSPRQACLVSPHNAVGPSYASLARYQQFSTSPIQYAETVVKVPQMAESISEGTLSSFTKQVGDYVEQDEEIASIETDKIDVSVNAPEAGKITELLVSEGDTVTVGQEIAKIEPGEGGGGGAKEAKQEPKEPASEDQPTSSQPEEPKEKKPKEEPKKEEPAPKKEEKPAPPKEEKKPAPPKEEKKDKKPAQEEPKGIDSPFGKGTRNENRVKMNRMRLRIAERLKQSQNTAASLTTFNEVDMSNIMEFRKRYKDEILKSTGVKLGFMSAFSKAAVLAMKDIPTVNASIEGPGGGDTIVYRDFVDISVAVATPKGLVTPVVRNAESMNMIEIEKAIGDLGKKARDGKLSIEDMAGGTFTISNGGVFGSMMGTPIINLPQTAVLGLHATKERPVVVDGKIEIRPMMYLALTYDHRLLDGREAVTFLVKIKEYIEDPRKMLLA
ncbi:2-oxoglutarate dehydrogenase complex E2 component [Elasticomyces elasticus]|uniref:dihydrolipoyllysine-residue succinyltransferase n=1 Tax=Exophiala sideris TaxID=1016849 RepID=A0ABR0JD81_9EURO|nr:2-oxoglutarate dehydrogenase complex E2 component [Elasticomyces elasticus]KAK5031367.1 2-oxoglutarate dehydrogenase complex E2 component [Exophiala sideris]KAK5039087.1 2-oxoglutarate dehydrogenase complex E2 component [Exophiala sideris]KAK5060972.1 2-oxoglutarate dehydrogenase complex E2 component [Exophiala sideris]KAK5183883.1 2-oxoglutarate dehydrogenase complex E2 component [Eurotiomycetes sp. CCFEE 6388]